IKEQAPWDIAVSTDGGATWTSKRQEASEANDLRPASAIVAWLTGLSSDLLRTIDGGAQWTDVRHRDSVPYDREPPPAFVVLGVDSAAYTTAAGGGVSLTVTVDGGRTWTTYPFKP